MVCVCVRVCKGVYLCPSNIEDLICSESKSRKSLLISKFLEGLYEMGKSKQNQSLPVNHKLIMNYIAYGMWCCMDKSSKSEGSNPREWAFTISTAHATMPTRHQVQLSDCMHQWQLIHMHQQPAFTVSCIYLVASLNPSIVSNVLWKGLRSIHLHRMSPPYSKHFMDI